MTIKPLRFSEQEFNNIFSHLQQLTGSVLLDSAAKAHSNSNFSVFAWAPKYLIEADLTETKVFEGDSVVEVSSEDPLLIIDKYLKQAQLKESELPFTGGAIGYWDYELGGRFEKLPAPKNQEITLPNMAIGIYDTLIVIDHKAEQSHFVCHNEDAEARYEQLLGLANGSADLDQFKLAHEWQSNMDKQSYSEKFHQVHEYLLSGDCYQINLAQRFSSSYQGDEWLAYQKLTDVNSAPFSSFIRLRQGAVLSLSPERFLQVNNDEIETKPIKGTRPRSAQPELDEQFANELKVAEKDRAENLMIVDLLRNDLSKVAVPGTVEVPKLFDIESFPAVHHLVSTVTAKLRAPYTSLDLLRGAFPGGSITGAPKIRAMQIINELEPDPRSVYCGAIGYIKPNGDMDTNITIRTLVCNNNKIYCWAGGGLVADSKCDDEYQETLDKVNKILPVLSQA